MSARQEFSEDFIEAFRADCMRRSEPGERGLPKDAQAAGITEMTNLELTIAEMREDRPDLYLRTAVQLVPKQVNVGVTGNLTEMLEQLRDRADEIRQFDPYQIPQGGRIIEAEIVHAPSGQNGQERRALEERPPADPQPAED